MTELYNVVNIERVAIAIRENALKNGEKLDNGECEYVIDDMSGSYKFRYKGDDMVHFEKTDYNGVVSNVYNHTEDGRSYRTTYDRDNDGIADYVSSHTENSHSVNDYYYDDGNYEMKTTEFLDDGNVFFVRYFRSNENSKTPEVSVVESYEYDEQGRVTKKFFDNEKNDGKSWFGKLLGFFAPKSSKDVMRTYTYDDKTGEKKERVKYGYFD